MDIGTPPTTTGPRLAEQRRGYGITRQALAEHLGLHRNTLRAWETSHEVDFLRARRYLDGLNAVVESRKAVA